MFDQRIVDVGMGDAWGVLGAVLPAAITAGGAVGSAFISADAATTVANDQRKAVLLSQLSQERIALAETKANQATASQGISYGTAALVLLGLVLLGGR